MVVRRRIDRQPMMASIGDQVLGENADRLGADALVVSRRRQEDVDARVAIHRIVLLAVLDRSDRVAVDLDDEDLRVADELVFDVPTLERSPSARHLGLTKDGQQLVDVVGPRRAKHDTRPVQREAHERDYGGWWIGTS